MARVGSWGAAAAAAFALAACGDARVAQTPLAAESDCSSCHTGPGGPPPFRDHTGSTDPNRLSVGAHDPHLHADLAAPLSCGDCHTVPQRVNDPGHLDALPPGIVQFGPLARTGGVTPRYESNGCAASYCHGNFPGGNQANAPKWLGGAAAGACGTCHGIPPSSGEHSFHVGLGIRCDQCHGPFLQEVHVNGVVDVAVPPFNNQTCAQACHAGGRPW